MGQLDVELPGGERIWWDVVHLFRSASAVVVDGNGRLLLVQRNRFVIGRLGWELPGGPVDEDEEPQEAAARELEDQTGYRASKLYELLRFSPEPRSVDGEHTIFLTRSPERIDSEIATWDIGRVEWIPLESVPGLVASGEIWAGATLVGLMKYLADER